MKKNKKTPVILLVLPVVLAVMIVVVILICTKGDRTAEPDTAEQTRTTEAGTEMTLEEEEFLITIEDHEAIGGF